MSRKYGRCAGIALLGLATWIPVVQAEPTILTNRTALEAEEAAGPEHGKINTPDASPVDPGHFEIESSYEYSHANRFWDNTGKDRSRKSAWKNALSLSATVGVFADVDMAVNGGYVWLKDGENDFDAEDGVLGPGRGHDFSDLELSGRYRFFASKEHSFELAYIGGVTIPTGNKSSQREIGTSQEFWSFNQTLVASKDWGKWTANGAIGYALPIGDQRGQTRGTFNADVAVGYQILPWLQPEVELNYGHDLLANEDDQKCLAATFGLVMPINDQLRVNAGVQQALWGRTTDKATSLLIAVKLAF